MTAQQPNGVLEKYLLRIIEERDKQYELRFKAVDEARRDALVALEKSQTAALIAQKEAIAAALTAQKEAIIKAEDAQRTYNAGHNDLARKMDSQYNTMMPRIEAQDKLDALKTGLEKAIDAHTDAIDSLRISRGVGQGQAQQSDKSTDTNRYIFALLIGVPALLLAVVEAAKLIAGR